MGNSVIISSWKKNTESTTEKRMSNTLSVKIFFKPKVFDISLVQHRSDIVFISFGASGRTSDPAGRDGSKLLLKKLI